MRRVGEDRGEQPAGDLVEGAQRKTGQEGPRRPHQVAAVGPDVDRPKDERGDHEAKLLLDRAAKERLLADSGEYRDQHEVAAAGAVHEARGELLGYLPQNREQTVSQKAQRDRGGSGQSAQEYAQGYRTPKESGVEPSPTAPENRRGGQGAVEKGREPNEAGSHRPTLRGAMRRGLHEEPQKAIVPDTQKDRSER